MCDNHDNDQDHDHEQANGNGNNDDGDMRGWKRGGLVLGSGSGGGGGGGEQQQRSYWRLKRASAAYLASREALLSTPTFRAWLVGGGDKQRFFVDERSGVVPLAAATQQQK